MSKLKNNTAVINVSVKKVIVKNDTVFDFREILGETVYILNVLYSAWVKQINVLSTITINSQDHETLRGTLRQYCCRTIVDLFMTFRNTK